MNSELFIIDQRTPVACSWLKPDRTARIPLGNKYREVWMHILRPVLNNSDEASGLSKYSYLGMVLALRNQTFRDTPKLPAVATYDVDLNPELADKYGVVHTAMDYVVSIANDDRRISNRNRAKFDVSDLDWKFASQEDVADFDERITHIAQAASKQSKLIFTGYAS